MIKTKLFSFPGGIHPNDNKLTTSSSIDTLALSEKIYLDLTGLENSGILTVEKGDYVTKGQCITKAITSRHLPIYAPTSGIIGDIELISSNSENGNQTPMCILISDGLDIKSSYKVQGDTLLEIVQNSSIVGMGGACFPTYIKLQTNSKINTLIINGVECEPYITADDILMQEKAKEILLGIELLVSYLSPKRVVIAIENNKKQAIKEMTKVLKDSSFELAIIPTKYPSGGEKQLIQLVTGEEIKSGGISVNQGFLVQNIGTIFAIYDGYYNKNPLLDRVVTVTGNIKNIKKGNYLIPIGTPISHILNKVGISNIEDIDITIGGPMMGYQLRDINTPVTKGTNCILVTKKYKEPDELACIRCGSCTNVCPILLQPQQMYYYSKAGEYKGTLKYNLFDCIECNCCTYVCPSNIPLVKYFKEAKFALKEENYEKEQASLAKERFLSKTQRIEKQHLARKQLHSDAAKKQEQQQTPEQKQMIADAIARAKAKKEASLNQDPNKVVDNLEPSDKPLTKEEKVAQAIAKAKAKKEASLNQDANKVADNLEPSDKPLTKEEKVAQAIAKAKAKKEASLNQDANKVADNLEPSDKPLTKEEKVAQAIARAKAKKEASLNQDPNKVVDNLEPSDKPLTKEEKVAQAIAKAKAKKEASLNQDANKVVDNLEASDKPLTKEEKIAQAIAKAKAKKEASLNQDANKVVDNLEASDKPLTKEEKIAQAIAKAKAKKVKEEDQK